MNNLSVRERAAITSLRSNGVAVKSLAGAFGVSLGVIYSATKGTGVSPNARLSSAKSIPTATVAPARSTRARKTATPKVRPASSIFSGNCN